MHMPVNVPVNVHMPVPVNIPVPVAHEHERAQASPKSVIIREKLGFFGTMCRSLMT